MNDIVKYKSIVARLFESNDSPSIEQMQTRKKNREENQIYQREWEKKEKNKGNVKKKPGRIYTDFGWTIERSFPDEEGEFQEVNIWVKVSGTYFPAYRGYEEPPHDAGVEDLEIEWAKIDTGNPNDKPLTMLEKIELSKKINNQTSSLYDKAIDALLEQMHQDY